MDTSKGLPVFGYVNQSARNIELVNNNKQDEERILRTIDALATMDGVDKRWLAIGRTSIEQAYMAINRSIFRPERVTLSE